MTTHHMNEARLITGLFALVCAIGCISAIIPAVEHTITAVLLVGAGLVVLAVALRLTARWLRERREDRADALTAAAWRAQHTVSARVNVQEVA